MPVLTRPLFPTPFLLQARSFESYSSLTFPSSWGDVKRGDSAVTAYAPYAQSWFVTYRLVLTVSSAKQEFAPGTQVLK